MRHTETMEDVLRYIDEHISQGLTAEELARVSGYSFYHFCHLFAIDMGLSVGTYLRRRRLELAAGEILQGGSITEISTKSGFETPSGFSKAFRRHYGMAPTEYKSKKGEIDVMTPEIKYVEGFSAVGYCLAPPEGEFDVLDASAYWLGKDFSSVSRADYAKLTYPGYAEIGAWMHPDQVAGEFYYFFGPQVKEKSFILDGMVLLDIPSAEYAVFLVPRGASVEEVGANVRKTWKYIFSEWFDQSEYQFDSAKIDFEYYLGKDAFIYVPVVKK